MRQVHLFFPAGVETSRDAGAEATATILSPYNVAPRQVEHSDKGHTVNV